MSHTREELEELFHELDVNGDGKLDICELEKVLQGPKFNFDEAKAHEISLVSGMQFIFALNKVIFFHLCQQQKTCINIFHALTNEWKSMGSPI